MQSKSNNGLIWKDIEGYEGIYQISNSGLIYTYPIWKGTRFDNPSISLPAYHNSSRCDYVTFHQRDNSEFFTVSELVAKAFVDNPNNYDSIRFKDGNIKNNDADNLEWVPREQSTTYGGEEVYQINFLGEIVNTYPSAVAAAKAIGCYHGFLHSALHGKRNTCYGYRWVYKKDYEKKKN